MFFTKFLNMLIPKTKYNIRLAKSVISTIQQYHSEGLLDINRYVESCLKSFITGFEDTLATTDFELGSNLENSNTAILRVKLSNTLAKVIKDISKRCAIAPEIFIATVLVMSFSNLVSNEITQNKKGVNPHDSRQRK